jgi:hypothetical protein
MDEETQKQVSRPGKRRWLGVAVLCALGVAVAAVAFWPGPKEPEYQGKKLSEWVDRASVDRDYWKVFGTLEVEEMAAQRKAIQQIGTNSIPYLVDWLGFERSSWRTRCFAAYTNLPNGLRNDSFGKRLLGPDAKTRRDGVISAFWFLGPRASNAVPALTNLLRDPNMSRPVIACLERIGEPAVPVLTALSTNPNINVRREAFVAVTIMKAREESERIRRDADERFRTNFLKGVHE